MPAVCSHPDCSKELGPHNLSGLCRSHLVSENQRRSWARNYEQRKAACQAGEGHHKRKHIAAMSQEQLADYRLYRRKGYCKRDALEAIGRPELVRT